MIVDFLRIIDINNEKIEDASNSNRKLMLKQGLFKIVLKVICNDYISTKIIYKKYVKIIFYRIDKK